MEKALKDTIIASKYDLTLKCFFKDQFKYGKDHYKYHFSTFYTAKNIFLVIFATVVILSAENKQSAMVISL